MILYSLDDLHWKVERASRFAGSIDTTVKLWDARKLKVRSSSSSSLLLSSLELSDTKVCEPEIRAILKVRTDYSLLNLLKRFRRSCLTHAISRTMISLMSQLSSGFDARVKAKGEGCVPMLPHQPWQNPINFRAKSRMSICTELVHRVRHVNPKRSVQFSFK